ncbi:MAG: TIGR04283 family arsenosugar biosynthesis glycosyltransferase, partial [Planctomycetota bacterium]
KTRLIPALGPEGAAETHRAMTGHTLSWVNRIVESRGVQAEVSIHGSTPDAFLHCFRDAFCPGQLSLSIQSDGDLGEKLFAALSSAYRSGAKRVAFVGTDCPDLSAERVDEAFESLNSHEVCFIPATDGGYTLLGIRFCEERNPESFRWLFEDIDWGTDSVLADSVAKSSEHDCKLRLLSSLRDVDHPEDLEVWERVQGGQTPGRPAVSVIIPTWNDEPALERTIEAIQTGSGGESRVESLRLFEPDVEVLVVAAGDTRRIRNVCAGNQVQLLESCSNRGMQLNAGAAKARGSVVLFLHADTLLPTNFMAEVRSAVQQKDVAAGAFTLSIESDRYLSHWIEFGVRLRSRFRQFPYGDQALFMLKEAFESVGGFPNQPIMEDYELVRRLRKIGKIHICQSAVVTSGRRWHDLGFLTTTAINQAMILGYHAGVPIEKLAAFYRRSRS